VGLLEPAVAEHRVDTARVEVEGPAAFVVGRAAEAERDHVLEPEQLAHDDRPVGPGARPGGDQPVAPGLDRPAGGVAGDPVREVVHVPLEGRLLDVRRLRHARRVPGERPVDTFRKEMFAKVFAKNSLQFYD